MESSSWLFQNLAALVYAIIGLRLLQLARRGGGLPEALLSSYFIASSVSYVGYYLPEMLARDDWYVPFTYGARLTYDVGMLPFLLFLRMVFHRGEHWADWLVGGSALLLVAGVAGSTITGDYEGVTIDTPWFWLEWLGYTLPFAWLASIAFAEQRSARRRVRIGLASPMVANRYLLWSLFGAVQVAASLALIPMYVDYARHGFYSAWADAMLGGLENLSLGLLWLVFFAPDAYRRWVGRGAVVAGAEAR